MSENWKPIPGWPYEASDLGNIRNAVSLHVLKPFVQSHEYRAVDLHGPNGAFLRDYVHRLILLAFDGPCPEGHEASHQNDVPTDNVLTNLAWETRLKNISRRKHAKGNQYTRAAERRRLAMMSYTQMEFA